jgi:hypothetical protein
MTMTTQSYHQLVSYIGLSAPANRRPATGNEPFLRPEIGFAPSWYLQSLNLDFGERWHKDPAYRRDTIIAMARETGSRFRGRSDIGVMQEPGAPRDVLTGTYGALLVAGMYGIPIAYRRDDWPWAVHGQELGDGEAESLEPPDLDENPFWKEFMGQIDWIEANQGRIEGFMNWQGVLNNAFRLRGNKVFSDMLTAPERIRHVFDCVTRTMIEATERLYERQRATGVEIHHHTISNCLVNMLSPKRYEEFQLPFDRRIAETFSMIGVHNCAWSADPYIDLYASLPRVAYIDMGMDSDLARAKEAFPNARRAIMYPPVDVETKSIADITGDLERIAQAYGPCDIVFADIQEGTPDARVHELIDACESLSLRYG